MTAYADIMVALTRYVSARRAFALSRPDVPTVVVIEAMLSHDDFVKTVHDYADEVASAVGYEGVVV